MCMSGRFSSALFAVLAKSPLAVLAKGEHHSSAGCQCAYVG